MLSQWFLLLTITVLYIAESSSIDKVEQELPNSDVGGVLSSDLQYVNIIDAGSTGSRLYVYSYEASAPFETMTAVSRRRVRPSLASFIKNETSSFDSEGLKEQFGQLISFAKEKIPEPSWGVTPLSIRATAGLRRMEPNMRKTLMDGAKEVLKQSASDFTFLSDLSGVISGDKEALYDIMAIMPISRKMQIAEDVTFGVIDLGGSSMQYAYQNATTTNSGHDIADYRDEEGAETCSIEEESFYLRSFSGLGLIESMEHVMRYHQGKAKGRHIDIDEGNPCVASDGVPYEGEGGEVVPGKGDFVGCLSLLKEVYLESMLEVAGEGVCSRSQRNENEYEYEEENEEKKMRPSVVAGLDNVPALLYLLGLHSPLEELETASGGSGVHAGSFNLISPSQIAESGQRVCAQPWQELLQEVDPQGSLPAYRGHRACYGASLLFLLLEEVVLGKCGRGGVTAASDVGLLLPLAELPRYGEMGWALGAALHQALQEKAKG